jgi:hypothetical protein
LLISSSMGSSTLPNSFEASKCAQPCISHVHQDVNAKTQSHQHKVLLCPYGMIANKPTYKMCLSIPVTSISYPDAGGPNANASHSPQRDPNAEPKKLR